MITDLGIDYALYQLLVDSVSDEILTDTSDETTGHCSDSVEETEPQNDTDSSGESALGKRNREKEELENKQKRYVSTISKQVSIKNGYLLRFPTGFANCVNGANFRGLTELMDSYLFHNCSIRYAFSNETNFTCAGGGGLVKFFSLVNAFYPDRITVVHTAVAGDNRLCASFFFKFTDCKYIYDSMLTTPIEPAYRSLFPPARADSLRRKMRLDCRPKPVQEQLESLVTSDKDLVVYGSIHMQMNVQEVTEKIIGINVIANFTSAHEATPEPQLQPDVHDIFNHAVPTPVST